jgi:Universal stress protein family
MSRAAESNRAEHGGPAPDHRAQAGTVVDAPLRGQRVEPAAEARAASHVHARFDAQAGSASVSRDCARRLLIPIDATERSRWALRYVLALRDEPLHVDLLFVAEPVTSLEVLRFRTQADIADFQHKTAHWLLEDAARPLQAAGVSVQSHFREGDVAGQIVEAAEQLGAEAIVLPPPRPRWINFLTRGIVRKVLRRARATAILHVDRDGKPVQSSAQAAVAH